jgi:acyl-CoA thioester hydrolase
VTSGLWLEPGASCDLRTVHSRFKRKRRKRFDASRRSKVRGGVRMPGMGETPLSSARSRASAHPDDPRQHGHMELGPHDAGPAPTGVLVASDAVDDACVDEQHPRRDEQKRQARASILRGSEILRLSVPGQPFTWTVRVYYEDTDTGGVVYYANYLKFFERARTEWLRAAGFGQQALAAEQGLQFVVARIECDYRRPARLDDVIDIDVRVSHAGRVAVVFEQVARRGDDVLAQARVRAGCVDTRTLAPRAMPAPMLAAMKSMVFNQATP